MLCDITIVRRVNEMKRILLNITILVIFIFGYHYFMENYTRLIAEKYQFGLLINVSIVPFVLGALACFMLRGNSIIRMLLVPLIPAVALFESITRGSDPAKPDLEYFVYFMLIAFFWVGAFAEIGLYNLYKYFGSKNTPNKSLKNVDALKRAP